MSYKKSFLIGALIYKKTHLSIVDILYEIRVFQGIFKKKEKEP